MMTPHKNRFLMTAALGATALLAASLLLSACGKEPSLKTAPPLWGAKAKADWSSWSGGQPSSSDLSFSDDSASSLSGGGTEATMSSSVSKQTERALPDGNGPNNTPDPYRGNQKVSDAPIEGSPEVH